MKEKTEFKTMNILPEVKMLTDGMVGLFRRYEIVGSIRREKEFVHDIDIVAIPQKGIMFDNKIIKGNIFGIPFEIYVADENTFETLKLIRTGSAEHNKMLCSLAKKKWWKLHADGKGLEYKEFSGVPTASLETRFITTEEGILKALLGKYVEPKDREVKS